MPTVGIPQALLYYEFFPLWKEFFSALGFQVVTSKPTSKTTLNNGVAAAVDETCLPVKIMYGHFLELRESCDIIFLPRLVSIEPKSYICPKFMGLPDILRRFGADLPILEPVVDLRSPGTYWKQLVLTALAVGDQLGIKSKSRSLAALFRGLQAQKAYRLRLYQGLLPNEAIKSQGGLRVQREQVRKIGVIGHPYTIFDGLVNMNLFALLEKSGCQVATPANYDIKLLNQMARQLPKDLFWTYGRRMIGAARLWYQRNLVDGIIHIVSFGCGTDSLTGDLIERLAKRESDLPFMVLTIDEHTGEAGFRTRVEAFLDMIQLRLDFQEEAL